MFFLIKIRFDLKKIDSFLGGRLDCWQEILRWYVEMMKSNLKKFLCAKEIKLDPRFISLPRFQILTEVGGQRDGRIRV